MVYVKYAMSLSRWYTVHIPKVYQLHVELFRKTVTVHVEVQIRHVI